VTKKIALITGASRGIGHAIYEYLSKDFIVIGTGTNQESKEKIENYIQENKIEGFSYILDLKNKSSIDEFISKISENNHFPDVLVNNAGITRDNIFMRMSEEEWFDIIDVHLNGQYFLIRAFIKQMVKRKWGRVINISSTSAAIGNKGQANYSAAKGAIEAMSRSIAREVGSRNITVNCVAPGFIETDMTNEIVGEMIEGITSQIPLNRLGQPEEIAQVVSFLASDNSNYITGQTIHVNGGLFM
tara:strand:- start:623 stop:1354 length:732 start_codon:yes stop_codon:yes gene_type:complete